MNNFLVFLKSDNFLIMTFIFILILLILVLFCVYKIIKIKKDYLILINKIGSGIELDF